ncbi:hypothetical protein DPMN_106293 [Dreissena polymorpha]|uniref:Uncharacterized protein n=1 Tax=Dreissena polymorpha TaxID=45954 RepID=A0A9D4K4W9_DREPO|nr:hypothetical protein DPMN_106293 [Dreissena polymorpha]
MTISLCIFPNSFCIDVFPSEKAVPDEYSTVYGKMTEDFHWLNRFWASIAIIFAYKIVRVELLTVVNSFRSDS